MYADLGHFSKASIRVSSATTSPAMILTLLLPAGDEFRACLSAWVCMPAEPLLHVLAPIHLCYFGFVLAQPMQSCPRRCGMVFAAWLITAWWLPIIPSRN